jgi:hypothetical protein
LGTVAYVDGAPKTFANLPYTFWVDGGSSVTYSYSSEVLSSVSGKKFRLDSVSGPASPFDVSAPVTVTGNYIIQYSVTFTNTGLISDATGTVLTVDGTPVNFTQLPYVVWVDDGGSVSYSYSSTVFSTVSGKKYRLDSVTGPESPINVGWRETVTGNYVAQYLVTIAQNGLDSTALGTVVTVNGNEKQYANLPYSDWFDSGSSITYLYNSTVSSSVSGKQFRLDSVSGPSSPIMVSEPTTVTGNYATQYSVTFAQTGVDPTATGTVVTINDVITKTSAQLPYSMWVDSGLQTTYSYNDIVLSSTTGKRFKLVNVSGPSSPITVSGPVTVTGNYKTQFQVIFDQTGVGTDYAGTIVTIDLANYNRNGLPTTPNFWWDKDSVHSFSFASPLTVNGNKQYVWSSTSGLSSLQSGTLTVTTSGSVVGNYIVENAITFAKDGIGGDFAGTIIIIDDTPYTLPQSFYWSVGTTHTFAFQSPLEVTPNAKRYVWTSTTGLSNQQSGSLTVSTYGSIIGHYKTQYFLNLATNPPSVVPLVGADWYDANTYVTITAPTYVDIVQGSSRYRFNGWTTADMLEIVNPSLPSTPVLVDKAKTVTANYVVQYYFTVNSPYGSPNPTSGWFDVGTLITASVTSPWPGSRHVCMGWTGNGSVPPTGSENSVTFTITLPSSITWNWKTQYYLTVQTSPSGITTIPGEAWYDVSTNVTLTAPTVAGYSFMYWDVGGAHQGTDKATIYVIMNAAHTATAHYKLISGPVGGYSISLAQPAMSVPLMGYTMVLAILGAVLALFRRKRK